MAGSFKSLEMRIKLPGWAADAAAGCGGCLASEEARMRFVLGLARENAVRRTGGPFGAAVFDAQGRLIAPGMNLVEHGRCSILHAEIVAIALAQKKLGRYDMGRGGGCYELVTSSEPCAMCYGAIPWSGLGRLVCGARKKDATAAGFDEGEKPGAWMKALVGRGIAVVRDVLREEAASVLRAYADSGGLIYNAGEVGAVMRHLRE